MISEDYTDHYATIYGVAHTTTHIICWYNVCVY